MEHVISMNSEGRLTIPAETRRQLGVKGDMRFQLEVKGGNLVLIPSVVVPLDDQWAYTKEHRDLLHEALEDSKEGRVFDSIER